MDRVYFAARWDKGTADYINCPMDRAEFDRFLDALLAAEPPKPKSGRSWTTSRAACRSKCWPRRGRDTLRFGPMKPVGLRDPRTGKTPWAVVQLRKENVRADSYNLVGFQNHLKFGEQARVLRLIPGLENARFLRYGQIHRNTYIQAPLLLDETLRLKSEGAPSFPRTLVERVGVQNIMFAGQLSGVEGYTESIATGCWQGFMRRHCARGRTSACSAIACAWARWCITLRTPIRKIFSRPTSPSTCWSRWKRNCARRFAIRRSGIGWCASGRWLAFDAWWAARGLACFCLWGGCFIIAAALAVQILDLHGYVLAVVLMAIATIVTLLLLPKRPEANKEDSSEI
jgi:hypothetical protein